MCDNFQVRTSKSPAKLCPTRITAWPQAAPMCCFMARCACLASGLNLILEVMVKQKFRNKINLRLRLEFVGTEMSDWKVKGLNFLSKAKLVDDLDLFILANFYFLLKELFPDTSVLFKFLHQIILTGSLKLLKYKARNLWVKFNFSAKYRRTNNLPELFRSNVLLVAFGIEFI